MITFFIKFTIALVGLILTLVYLLIGLIKGNRINLKIAVTVFVSSIGVILLIASIEFLLHDKKKDYLDKETVLVAMREASLGGIHLRVYVDSTYDLGNESNVTLRGKIKIQRDTLFLLRDDSVAKSFVLDKSYLKEIKNTGINFLLIESNKVLSAEVLQSTMCMCD